MKTKLIALGVVIGLIFIGCALRAKPVKDDAIKVTFPERIGTLDLKGRQQYPMPGLGYSLRYQDEHLFKADVYVYDKNLTDIGDGIDSNRVKQELDSDVVALSMMEKMKKYKDVKNIGRGTTSFPKGNLQFLWSRYQYRELPGPGVAYVGLRISETYLSGKSGKFIKVRITLTAEEFKERQGEIGGFMKHLAGILGPHDTAPAEH